MAWAAGDESGLTHNGNNNWYGHDQPWAQMQWQLGEAEEGLLRFTRELMQLRRQHPALGRDSFMGCVRGAGREDLAMPEV